MKRFNNEYKNRKLMKKILQIFVRILQIKLKNMKYYSKSFNSW